MKRMLHLSKPIWKLVVLLFLVVLTFSYAMFQGGFVSWFLFYSFLPFAVYALLLTFYSPKRVEVERVFSRQELHAGEPLSVTILLKRRFAFPLFYLVLEDVVSEQLAAKKAIPKKLIFPRFQREIEISYDITKLPRGEHVFQGVRLKYGDLLGLVEKETIVPVMNQLIVYPQVEELVYRPFENRYDQGMTASRERVQRDTTMAVGIREYQNGDKVSWINWKASAKRSELMTKEFEQRQSHDLFLVLDCAPDDHFETAVSFTASLIKAILRKGAQLGLLTISGERMAFPVRSGEDHQQGIFYHLAKIKATSTVSLDQVLVLERMVTSQNSSFMLITSQLTKSLLEEVSSFSLRKGTVTIFLMKHELESLQSWEVALKQSATARGIQVIPVHEGQFESVFAEVSRR